MADALAWRGLSHRHPGAPVLGFADTTLAAGGTLLLRGDSGSGKSTLLALIAGLLAVQQGELTAGGVALQTLGPAARDAWRGATLGIVPQRLHLSESLSVRDNLALPYLAAGQRPDDDRIAQVLQRLGLQGLGARRPSALSGGQAQRVALARALLRRPALLLADEPTASLDDGHADAAVALLREAAAETGAALLVATHDARVVRALPHAQVLTLPAPPLATAA